MSHTLLCSAAHCRDIGRHIDSCIVATCTGCRPRSAADGLNLCWGCVRRLDGNAVRAAEVYYELAEQLAPVGTGGEMVAGTRDRGLKLNPRAVASRTNIVAVLTAWTKLIVDERGFDPPKTDPVSMAQFISNSSVWLAAYPAADDAADELRELARGEPWRVAYPSHARAYPLNSVCPEFDDKTDLRCSGHLKVIKRHPDSPRRTEIVCDPGEHRWAPHQWLPLAVKLRGQGLAIEIPTLGGGAE